MYDSRFSIRKPAVVFLEQYLQEATEHFETLRVFIGDSSPRV